MPAPVTTESVWAVVNRRMFAVLGYVTPRGEARTAGVVYVVHDGRLWVGTGKASWKARHIARAPGVSLTVTIPKRIPFVPWIEIPAATISLHGNARVLSVDEVPDTVTRGLLRGLVDDQKVRADMVVVEIEPVGDFVTYGVGVTMMQMRDQELARGRAPVRAPVAEA